MCGIAGWYRRGGTPVSEAALVAACDAIRHRGPDDSGTLAEGDFGFGMRRLSLLDLAGGHQPMLSADGRFAIVFNGEVYNHLELRPALEAAGFRFRTHCDTETVLAAFCHWGGDAWARLEGMFAAAVWDRRERQLTLARDPLGIKPLFITEQRGGLAFASEIKALRALPDHRFTVDERAVHDALSVGHVRPPRTILSEIRVLPPGHSLVLGPEREARETAFWHSRRRRVPARRAADWVEEFRELWLDTVRRHLLADVPLGVFLSGGVDSSAVAAAMAKLSGRPVRAFTIGFPGTPVDETEHARRVAQHLGLQHEVRPLELRDAADLLPELVRCFDEPFADPAAVPMWHLSAMAAGEVKAVLGGDGGDEIFAGYRRHRTEQRLGRFAGLGPAIRPLGRAMDALPALPSRRAERLRAQLGRLRDAALLPDGSTRFLSRTQITSAALRARFYEPGFHGRQDGPGALQQQWAELLPSLDRLNDLDQFLHVDLTLQLPGQMLTKVDRASMAHSLEVRVPFLSHRLVDWAGTVPTALKLRGGEGKRILRRAVAPWLPPATAKRRKQGFKLPLAAWFAGDFGAHARAIWHDSGAARAGFLRPDAADTLLREHASGGRDHGRLLYTLAVFGHWWEQQGRG
ncbi:asparagine synthase (glutamine-hydrolyzing) [Roseomonas sp. BN140053]|uniref:asparagine synthase (glutamine-hydrolyzing) n=1 Tax=Roseomonas sp. BN140053 TaxID=3391898 RepID=UPI0039EAC6C2